MESGSIEQDGSATETCADAALPAISDYELVKVVGRGSNGEVWLARGVTGSWRAVKVIRRDRFERAQPFEREFRAVCRYQDVSRGHAHMVDVLHVGRDEAGTFFYYVMELADAVGGGREVVPDAYVPHTVLHDLEGGLPHPVDACLELAEAICGALVHLHAGGLVHRDVKPSNIVYVDGLPRLVDIGLVAPMGRRSFVGTNGYIAPEGPGSESADLYALGKVLYELLTGQDRLAFPDLPQAAGGQVWSRQKRALNQVILRACHSDADRRYRNAPDMMEDLRRIQAGRGLRPSMCLPTWLPAAAGALLLGSLAWLGSGLMTRRPGTPTGAAAGQSRPALTVADLPAAFRAMAVKGLARDADNYLDRITILQGEFGASAIDPAAPVVRVRPGWPVAGRVRVLVRNVHGPEAVYPVAWMPSWEHGADAVRVVTVDQRRFEQEYIVQVEARAPERPGWYYLLFAAAGQLTAHNIMSATGWSRPDDRWDDGNDLNTLSDEQVAWAIRHGWVPVRQTGSGGGPEKVIYGAAAIRIEVTEPGALDP